MCVSSVHNHVAGWCVHDQICAIVFYKIPKMYGCIHTSIIASHLKCNVRRLVSSISNCTLPFPNVHCHTYSTWCSKNAYDSKNNPFNGGKDLRPISITRQLYSPCPSHHFLMYFSVTICQYCCRFWPKNGNSKTSWQPVQIVPLFTRMHPILQMLRDCYSTRNSCLYTQGMLCHVH